MARSKTKAVWVPYRPDLHPWQKSDVEALHRAMEKRLGLRMDFPNLTERPIIESIVRIQDGRVTNCIYLEAEIEACALGETPLTAVEAKEAIEQYLLPTAQHYGLRIVRCFVPTKFATGKRKNRPGAVARLLEKLGFTREGSDVVQFYRWLVPTKKDKDEGDSNG